MRSTATRRRPRTRVEVEGPSRERAEKVFRFFWWTSCRKGGDGAGEDDREGGGRERERRMVTARMRGRSGREQSRLWVRQRMLGTRLWYVSARLSCDGALRRSSSFSLQVGERGRTWRAWSGRGFRWLWSYQSCHRVRGIAAGTEGVADLHSLCLQRDSL